MTNSILEIKDENKKFLGTCFVIDKNNKGVYVLTCGHVVKKYKNCIINDKEAKVLENKYDNGLDLAILYVENLILEPLEISETITSCSNVKVTGYSKLKIYNKLETEHNIEIKKIELSTENIKINAIKLNTNNEISQGYSGSPIICSTSNKVIGVVFLKEGDNKNYGIAANHIKEIHKNLITVNNIELNLLFDSIYTNFKKKFQIGKKYIRKIKLHEVRQKFTLKPLEFICLNEKDLEMYNYMLDLISNHSFSPHRPYIGTEYYVKIPENEVILNNYLNNIITKNYKKPFIYIGARGTGKTLLQNIWLHENFTKIEENKIFHVRCDVHKIYDLMHEYPLNDFNLDIESYLDMQFLYIFLKYRNKKYNNKGLNNTGVTSKLMSEINNLVQSDNTDILKDTKYNNLISFIDKQSKDIYHSEVNIRSENDKDYSYALNLMKNIKRDTVIEDIINDYINFSDTILSNKKSNLLDKFFITLADRSKEKYLKEIRDTLQVFKNCSDLNTKIMALKAILLKISEEINTSNKRTTDIWLKVSRYIQEKILRNNYKILKIIDGIDNIIIQDSQKDRAFFETKIQEVLNIMEATSQRNIFYLISLRNDTFEEIETKITAGYELNSNQREIPYDSIEHKNPNDNITEIINKRHKVIEKVYSEFFNNSIYAKILNKVFTTSQINDDLININNIRMILRHYLFLSLQINFEFYRRKISSFNQSNYNKFYYRVFKETFFLRNKLYVDTGNGVMGIAEDKYKVFPNIFFSKTENSFWNGLCRIRILQLLKNDIYSKEEIINQLSCLYDKEFIESQIDRILAYNLIETKCEFNLKERKKEKNNDNISKENLNIKEIKYKISYKGKYLLDLINYDLNILYYLSLDTNIPKNLYEYDDIYRSVFKRTEGLPKNTGYSNSIIKTVFTFVLFIKYIHEKELRKIRNNKSKQIFNMPINIKKIEELLRELFNNRVKNQNDIFNFLKKIGYFEDDEFLIQILNDSLWIMHNKT